MSRIRIQLLLISVISLIALFEACKTDSDISINFSPTAYSFPTPTGFPQPFLPSDNPMTIEGIQLGRQLFYDPILSADFTVSCANCHHPALAFSDSNRYSKGVNQQIGIRNAQALINMAFQPHFFWDGRATSLEQQISETVTNPSEMHLPWKVAVQRLNQNKDYKKKFQQAFGQLNVDSTQIIKALAQFTRTLVSNNSKFDKYLRGEINLTVSELNGFTIFNTEKGDCFHCHPAQGGRLFTDRNFHNNALDAEPNDKGREWITGKIEDRGKFLTPTLRNISLTAPYMHDGRFQTLEEVVEHYNSGGVPSPYADPLMKYQGVGLGLTAQEKTDLINFLKTLTDESFITNPDFLKE
jgi:cytochrome c peroxidase